MAQPSIRRTYNETILQRSYCHRIQSYPHGPLPDKYTTSSVPSPPLDQGYAMPLHQRKIRLSDRYRWLRSSHEGVRRICHCCSESRMRHAWCGF